MAKRIHIDPAKIINPTFQGVQEAGCEEGKVGTCPMMSDLVPDKKNGCEFCRKVKGTWIIRTKIIELIDENDLKNMEYWELDDDNEVKKLINKSYRELGYLIGDPLFDYVKQYCSFEDDRNAIRVQNQGKQIENGRHRIKIAQNLGIKIPLHWN